LITFSHSWVTAMMLAVVSMCAVVMVSCPGEMAQDAGLMGAPIKLMHDGRLCHTAAACNECAIVNE